MKSLKPIALALAAAVMLSGCVLTPKGADAETARLNEAGREYEPPVEERQLPELPEEPTWRDVLRRAFLANGELEAAYFEWKAAMQRVPQAAGYPNQSVMLGFDYMFSDENLKGWDRTTIQADFMDPIALPRKVRKAGQIALADAQAAGRRFEAAKFDLQQRVLSTYADYALAAERVRIGRQNVELLRMLSETAANRVAAGASQQELLRADVAYRLAQNELATTESALPQLRAELNALMGREPTAPLPAPKVLPALRPLPADDAALILIATDKNPELAALAHEVQGRRDAVELARMQYIPDFNPFAAITGDVSQLLGASLVVPTNLPQIRGAIDEARAMVRGSEATLRQARLERSARFVAALYALRNYERQIELFETSILPATESVLSNARQRYAAGTGMFQDLIESQRTLLDVRLTVAEARAAREKRLAELETLAGVDVETLTENATTRPSTQPSAPAADAAAEEDHHG